MDQKLSYLHQNTVVASFVSKDVRDLIGSNNSAAMQYGFRGIPDDSLIDLKGKIIARNNKGKI